MPKFQVNTTQLAYVTWSYVIEAQDEDEALEKYYQGDHEAKATTRIGDSPSFADDTEESVIPLPETEE